MNTRKKVLCPVQLKSGKTKWMHCGAAFENRDGSWNVHLDLLPPNGRLQIRELDERDLKPKREREEPPTLPAVQGIIPF